MNKLKKIVITFIALFMVSIFLSVTAEAKLFLYEAEVNSKNVNDYIFNRVDKDTFSEYEELQKIYLSLQKDTVPYVDIMVKVTETMEERKYQSLVIELNDYLAKQRYKFNEMFKKDEYGRYNIVFDDSNLKTVEVDKNKGPEVPKAPLDENTYNKLTGGKVNYTYDDYKRLWHDIALQHLITKQEYIRKRSLSFDRVPEHSTGWVKIDDNWYYYDSLFLCKNMWIADDNKTYWVDERGVMYSNQWLQNDEDKNWYWLGEDGSRYEEKWLYNEGQWYWLDKCGVMYGKGWLYNQNEWYWLNASGRMSSQEWIYDNNSWYWVDKTGRMYRNEWLEYANKWYYFADDGSMLKGEWKWINGKCYYFYENGAMASNTNIDGSYVDSQGVWVK